MQLLYEQGDEYQLQNGYDDVKRTVKASMPGITQVRRETFI